MGISYLNVIGTKASIDSQVKSFFYGFTHQIDRASGKGVVQSCQQIWRCQSRRGFQRFIQWAHPSISRKMDFVAIFLLTWSRNTFFSTKTSCRPLLDIWETSALTMVFCCFYYIFWCDFEGFLAESFETSVIRKWDCNECLNQRAFTLVCAYILRSRLIKFALSVQT